MPPDVKTNFPLHQVSLSIARHDPFHCTGEPFHCTMRVSIALVWKKAMYG